jgi:membrane protease YdiL (CAAX protease family)
MLFGIVMILILATISIAALFRSTTPAGLLLLQSLGVDGAGLAVLAWYVRTRKLGWNLVFGLQLAQLPRSLRLGLYFYLSILPIVFFSSLIYQGILSAHGYPPTLQDVALLLTGDNPWWIRLYMLFMAVILAPLFEECLFRGILLPLMARRFGVGSGIVFSSLIFAVIHFHVPSMVPLCAVAIGFSMGYLYSGSLWVPVTMHALFNGINLGLLLLIRQ